RLDRGADLVDRPPRPPLRAGLSPLLREHPGMARIEGSWSRDVVALAATPGLAAPGDPGAVGPRCAAGGDLAAVEVLSLAGHGLRSLGTERQAGHVGPRTGSDLPLQPEREVQ